MNTPDKKERAVIFHRSRAWTDAASRGYQLLIEDGKLSASLIHFWPGNAIRVKTKQELPLNQWIDVSVVYDGSVDAAGLSIFVDGQKMELEIVKNKLTKNKGILYQDMRLIICSLFASNGRFSTAACPTNPSPNLNWLTPV